MCGAVENLHLSHDGGFLDCRVFIKIFLHHISYVCLAMFYYFGAFCFTFSNISS